MGSIICGCNENNQFWDLLCNGQMHTDAAAFSTIVPEADITRPVNLERLISACGGVSETDRYLVCCRKDMPFSVSDAMLQVLRQGLYANVISSNRVETTIPNVYKTHNYVLSPASALAYAGMLDYRAKTGITRPVIVLCDDSPACKTEIIAKIMDMPVEALQKLI